MLIGSADEIPLEAQIKQPPKTAHTAPSTDPRVVRRRKQLNAATVDRE